MNWIQFLFGLSVGGNLVFSLWWIYNNHRFDMLDSLTNYLKSDNKDWMNRYWKLDEAFNKLLKEKEKGKE